eukprot:CAMPEP_0185028280 /NCGR_PEP_ID=MMETSP1103-20130426/13938_1 /TAXON_ID=36769 /ORGANISM="Paraphysomonas bandaiensis, Strain Caron Lab Isolate" /LENGTH=349 /DNA_ID=CAMNT_0027562655 /DNA_START=46 /DNA_END=1092 /DNA_ORIENTATION=+
MDAVLLNYYRVLWSEFVILYDAATVYHKRRPTGKSVKEFGEGLHALVKSEINSNSPAFYDDDEILDFSEDRVIRKVLWQFTHGVVLEFIAEELSQYPFWAAKVVTVVNKSYREDVNVLRSAFRFFEHTYARGGIRAIFEGNVPYLAAAAVVNYDHLQKTMRGFITVLESHLPRLPSSSLSLNQQGKGQKSAKRRRSNDFDGAKKNEVQSSWTLASTAGRVAIAVMVHPLLLLSVRMITDPQLRSQNWLSAYWSLVSTQGIPVLYTGLRISLSLALLPLKPVYSLGVPECVLFRRMSGQGVEDRFGGSFSVIYSALVEEGALGLVGYGILTAAQVIPGFLSFVASRWCLW